MGKSTSRLSSGKYIDLAAITEEDIKLEDINTSLNWQFRFNGHHRDKDPLTVAQHTVLAMRIGETLFPGDLLTQLDVLLHDMPEAFYGDIVSPIKQIIKTVLKPYCEAVDQTLYDKLWTPKFEYTGEIHDRRVVCDLTSLDFERRNMWSSQMGKENWPDVGGTFKMVEMRQMFDAVQAQRFWDLPTMYGELIERIARS
jgi:hypothetical protein